MQNIWNVFECAKASETRKINNVFVTFLQNSGLYDKMDITPGNLSDLLSLINGEVPLRSYCVECKQDSVFTMDPIKYVREDFRGNKTEHPLGEFIRVMQSAHTPGYSTTKEASDDWRCNDSIIKETQVLRFSYRCKMDESHRIEYPVATDATSIRKIGQFPSVADLSYPELMEYKKVLSKDDLAELRRGIGLYAHNIGVGSFVYLRRIYEKIIESARKKAISDGKFTVEEYSNAHVDQKIKMLKGYLPDEMVDNTVFYSIVSKGIHELSEEECVAYFPVLKEFILIILREWDKQRKDNKSKQNLSSSMSQIASAIK